MSSGAEEAETLDLGVRAPLTCARRRPVEFSIACLPRPRIHSPFWVAPRLRGPSLPIFTHCNAEPPAVRLNEHGEGSLSTLVDEIAQIHERTQVLPRLPQIPISPPQINIPPRRRALPCILMNNVEKLDEKRRSPLCQMGVENKYLERPTFKQEIVAFVNKLERAHDYFDFKDFLSAHYSLSSEELWDYDSGLAIRRFLVNLPKHLHMFNTLSQHDIIAAVHAHLKFHLALVRPYQKVVPSSNTSKMDQLLNQLEEEDQYGFSSPVFRLVFLSRKQAYDMDLCPELELEMIKDSPKYCGDYTIFNESTVMWKETDVGVDVAVPFARKYEESCRKYGDLRLRRSRNVKTCCNPVILVAGAIDNASKGEGMSDKKRKRNKNDWGEYA